MNTQINVCIAAGLMLLASGFSAQAYDGTNCKEPGVCWEPKPGFPDKIAGSKYDPKHDPNELSKQAESHQGMDERNAKRVANFNKTGQFIYDVDDIDDQEE